MASQQENGKQICTTERKPMKNDDKTANWNGNPQRMMTSLPEWNGDEM